MDLTCPACHKHRFATWNFLMSRFGGNEYPIICPQCGTVFSLDKKSGDIINLITLASLFAYIGLIFELFPPLDGTEKIAMAIGGVAASGIVRLLAISRFGKMVPYEMKPSEPYPRIKLSDVRPELDRLKKNRDFFTLYTPDESAYLSFGIERGVISADLAFAIGKYEALEPAFRAAVEKVGAVANSYNKSSMRGVEAELGSDLDAVATKIQTIMREVFHLKADAEVPVMRN